MVMYWKDSVFTRLPTMSCIRMNEKIDSSAERHNNALVVTFNTYMTCYETETTAIYILCVHVMSIPADEHVNFHSLTKLNQTLNVAVNSKSGHGLSTAKLFHYTPPFWSYCTSTHGTRSKQQTSLSLSFAELFFF